MLVGMGSPRIGLMNRYIDWIPFRGEAVGGGDAHMDICEYTGGSVIGVVCIT